MADKIWNSSAVDAKREKDGIWIQPSDKEFFWPMLRAEYLIRRFNKTPLWFQGRRNRILHRMLGSLDGDPLMVASPFYVQHGKNIHIGKNFFSNLNCMILDHTDITIGDNVLLGPNVTIATYLHPMLAEERNVQQYENSFEKNSRGDIELDKPISIGNSVWIATGVIICPGVTIGDNTVIGAGSVVTRDIPANVFACGTPCRVIREITEADRSDWQEKCKYRLMK